MAPSELPLHPGPTRAAALFRAEPAVGKLCRRRRTGCPPTLACLAGGPPSSPTKGKCIRDERWDKKSIWLSRRGRCGPGRGAGDAEHRRSVPRGGGGCPPPSYSFGRRRRPRQFTLSSQPPVFVSLVPSGHTHLVRSLVRTLSLPHFGGGGGCVGFGVGAAGTRQKSFWNFVPGGQAQFGGVPTMPCRHLS